MSLGDLTLTKNQYIWAVNVVSPDDGRTGTVAWFTDMQEAESFALRNNTNGRVVQAVLWKGSDGNWYDLPYVNKVLCDAPSREEVLAKLTPTEREVLGL